MMILLGFRAVVGGWILAPAVLLSTLQFRVILGIYEVFEESQIFDFYPISFAAETSRSI